MIEEMYKEEFGDESELLISKSSQEPNSTNQEDSSSQQQQQQDNNNNSNLAYSSADTTNIVFSSETKPDRVLGNDNDPQQQQINRSSDYDTLMNYHGFGVDDYRYISGSNQQESRFSNSHHLHDFVVWYYLVLLGTEEMILEAQEMCFCIFIVLGIIHPFSMDYIVDV